MPPELETFAPGGLGKRRLYLLDIDRAEDLEEIEFYFEQHSSIILAWDSSDASEDIVATVAQTILDRGAVSISCWGEDCQRVHQAFAEAILGTGETSPYSSSIMTTWHARERFDEALWYALFVAQPTDLFEKSCRDSLVLLIDQPQLAISARAALRDPDTFSEQVLSGNESA